LAGWHKERIPQIPTPAQCGNARSMQTAEPPVAVPPYAASMQMAEPLSRFAVRGLPFPFAASRRADARQGDPPFQRQPNAAAPGQGRNSDPVP
jgi:hypothetical protein